MDLMCVLSELLWIIENRAKAPLIAQGQRVAFGPLGVTSTSPPPPAPPNCWCLSRQPWFLFSCPILPSTNWVNQFWKPFIRCTGEHREGSGSRGWVVGSSGPLALNGWWHSCPSFLVFLPSEPRASVHPPSPRHDDEAALSFLFTLNVVCEMHLPPPPRLLLPLLLLPLIQSQ